MLALGWFFLPFLLHGQEHYFEREISIRAHLDGQSSQFNDMPICKPPSSEGGSCNLENLNNSAGLANKADLIVFSYNRPLQLYAFLESVEKRVTGLNKVSVILRSDDYFASGYEIVKDTFWWVEFVEQSKGNPRGDFKPHVMELSFKTEGARAPYILYAVDDIIITQYIDIQADTKTLESTGAYGFYYRLGEGIDYCYSENLKQGVPNLTKLQSDIYMWEFAKGKGDWEYPNSVDFVLYAKKDLQDVFSRLFFTYPNDFEGAWAGLADKSKRGLCHKQAKLVNLPLNIVSSFSNRSLNSYSPQTLNDMFLAGLKIDVEALWNVEHNSAHADIEIQFVPRGSNLTEGNSRTLN